MVPARHGRGWIGRALGLSLALLIVAAVWSPTAVAQAWPRCIDICTANDIQVMDVYLAGISSCSGATQMGQLYVTLSGQRTYHCVLVVVDVWVNGSLVKPDLWRVVTTRFDGPASVPFYVGDITWTCNQRVEIRNIYVAWAPKEGCTGTCVEYRAGSKCTSAPTYVVYAPLEADFGTPASGCAPLAVQFTDLTTGGMDTSPYTYAWDFDGDGAVDSTDPNPQHTYTQAGSYTVKLTVTDALGTTDSETKTNYITATSCGVDLVVTKSVAPVTARVGDILAYTIGVKNEGLSSATNAVLTDFLPSGLSNTQYSKNGGPWQSYDSGSPIALGTIAPNGTATVLIHGTATCSAVGTLLNLASASSDGPETNPWSNQASVSSSVVDDQPPTISCPPDVTVNADLGQCTASGVGLGVPTTSDNCTVNPATNDAPATFPIGTTTVTWTVTDASGNRATCTQRVIVVDNQAPTISCPGNVTVSTGPGRTTCDQVATWVAPTASDNCSGVSLSSTHNPGAVFPLGTTTVTYTARDGAGNEATCTFTVTVVDSTPPTIIGCPGNVAVSTGPGRTTCDQVATWVAPTASDNCSGVSLSSTHNPGAVFPLGTTTVTYTARDGAGNTASCSFTVTVIDNTPPTISCPPNLTDVSTDPGKCYATNVALGTPTTSDNCGGVLTVVNDAPAQFPKGDTVVKWTVTDTSGNSATCQQTVTVKDHEAPTISCPANITRRNDPGICQAYVTVPTPSTADNCGVASVINDYTGNDDASAVYPVGTTTVTWTVTDIHGNTARCSFLVTIQDVDHCGNHPPTAVDDTYTTPEDTLLAANNSGPGRQSVLANDSDPDGDPLAVSLVSNVLHGTLALASDGTFTYLPFAEWSGTDQFTYSVDDGKGGTAYAQATIIVTPVNDPPLAMDDVATTSEDTPVVVNVPLNDTDVDGNLAPTTVAIVDGPDNGTAIVNPLTGQVTYTPDPNYNGPDTFTYQICDTDGLCDTATVTVDVGGLNDPPLAVDDPATTPEDTPVEIPVLVNDSDPDGTLNPATVAIVSGPDHGSVAIVGGVVTYTPDPGFHGIDRFTYTVADNEGATSNVATVTIRIPAGTIPPVAVDDLATTNPGTPVAVDILLNDWDTDGVVVPSTVRIISQPANGTVVVNPDGTITYTPQDGFAGTDQFTYTVEDDDGNVSNTALVTIEVPGVAGGGGAVADSCAGKIVISEIGWAGTAADARDEWIELRNLGTVSVDLTGWTLRWRRTRPVSVEDYEWKVVELYGVVLPGEVSACQEAEQERVLPVEISRRDETSWLVVGDVVPATREYYLLERRHEETISNVLSSQVYDLNLALGLELTDVGDELQLVNAEGVVVDTANAFHPGEDGWAAGNAAMFASMERTDLLGPDAADNWHTNLGLITHGLDSAKKPLIATAAVRNSADLDALILSVGIEPTQIGAGESIEVTLDLTKKERKEGGWPWIYVVRPDLAAAAGGGGAVEGSGYSFAGRQVDQRYVLRINTAGLAAGTYDFWVVVAPGKAVLIPIVVL